VHPAWGYEHILRIYAMAVEIARAENIAVDKDVLLSAAILHDMGAFPACAVPSVDHAVRSTQLAESVLAPATIYGGAFTRTLIEQRLAELTTFLDALDRETYEFGVLHK
jgi:HD superfamily phosphodiesterase